MRRRLATALAAGLAALGAAGCGSSSPGRPVARPTTAGAARSGACAGAVRAVVARSAQPGPTAGAVAVGVGVAAFTAPSGAPGCRFTVARPGAPPLTVQVDVDRAPQAYARLERQAVEYSQTVLWSHQGAGAYPRTVAALGLAADWFPAERRLLATDGSRLVDVVVTWPGASSPAERALAEAVARPYLQGR